MCARLPAVVAVEVIRVVRVILEQEGLLLNNGVALLTDVLAEAPSFLPVVTWTTQVPDGREDYRQHRTKGETLD